jgi:hypothetical protein
MGRVLRPIFGTHAKADLRVVELFPWVGAIMLMISSGRRPSGDQVLGFYMPRYLRRPAVPRAVRGVVVTIRVSGNNCAGKKGEEDVLIAIHFAFRAGFRLADIISAHNFLMFVLLWRAIIRLARHVLLSHGVSSFHRGGWNRRTYSVSEVVSRWGR